MSNPLKRALEKSKKMKSSLIKILKIFKDLLREDFKES